MAEEAESIGGAGIQPAHKMPGFARRQAECLSYHPSRFHPHSGAPARMETLFSTHGNFRATGRAST